MIAEIATQHTVLGKVLGWSPIQWLSTAGDIPAEVTAELTDYAGSWSISTIPLVHELFGFVGRKARRQDLPDFGRKNRRMRRAAFEAVTLMLMRGFEFDNLGLPADYQHGAAVDHHRTQVRSAARDPAPVRASESCLKRH